MSTPHVLLNHHHRDVLWETAAVTFGVLFFIALTALVIYASPSERIPR